MGAFPRLWEVLRTPQERVICFREKKRERDRQTDRDRLVQRRENTFFTIETPAHRIARLEGVFFAADETERRKVRTRERTHFPIYFGWTKPDSAIAESICCFFSEHGNSQDSQNLLRRICGDVEPAANTTASLMTACPERESRMPPLFLLFEEEERRSRCLRGNRLHLPSSCRSRNKKKEASLCSSRKTRGLLVRSKTQKKNIAGDLADNRTRYRPCAS